jgi:TldD protein
VTHPGLLYFGAFGVDAALLHDALAEAMGRGGDFADLYFEHSVSRSLGLEDGAVNRASAGVDLGVGVRVVRGDQTGYAYTEDLNRAAVLQAARTAAAIADGPAGTVTQPFRVGTVADRYPVQRPWEQVSTTDKLPLIQQLEQQAWAADPRIQKVNLYLGDRSGAVMVATSDGDLVFDRQPMTVLSLSCSAAQDGRRESGGANIAARDDWSFYTPARLDRLVRDAVSRTTQLFEASPAPAGEMQVVLGAGSSGILLHEAIGHGLEADFNRKGVSIYAGKIGQAIASPLVTIVDDATVAHSRGAINVDDEGNPAGCTHLVEQGVLASYLHDRISARFYGVQPTGNGRRESFRSPPLPRMRATYMLPGPHTRDEIIASVQRGIYCDQFANGQVQIGAGDFSFYVRSGWLIEDGKLTRPVKDVNLIGNGPKVLEQIDMVGDDLQIDEGGWTCGKDGQSVPVSQGMPSVRVRSMTVGGRA